MLSTLQAMGALRPFQARTSVAIMELYVAHTLHMGIKGGLIHNAYSAAALLLHGYAHTVLRMHASTYACGLRRFRVTQGHLKVEPMAGPHSTQHPPSPVAAVVDQSVVYTLWAHPHKTVKSQYVAT